MHQAPRARVKGRARRLAYGPQDAAPARAKVQTLQKVAQTLVKTPPAPRSCVGRSCNAAIVGRCGWCGWWWIVHARVCWEVVHKLGESAHNHALAVQLKRCTQSEDELWNQ